MILVILFVSVAILGFLLIFACDDVSIPVLMIVCGIIACLVCGVTALCERTKGAYNSYYKEWNRKHLGLEARIEAWNRGGEDPYLWEDVKEFNSDLEYAQYWANNYWTNWMNEQACNEFETFDIPEYKRSNENE